MKVLIIGFGSIGKRHADNARALGHQVASWDIKTCHTSLDKYVHLMSQAPTHAVICTYVDSHFDYARKCLQYGMHVLVEKPLCETAHNGEVLATIAQTMGKRVVVGYQMRFLPAIQQLKTKIDDKGLPIHGSIVYSYDIHKWRRPGQPSYTQRAGVLREVSHEFDYLLYVFSNYRSRNHQMQVRGGVLSHISSWGETTECSASILFECGGCPVQVTLDYVSPVYERRFKFVWEDEVFECFLHDCNLMDQAYKAEMEAFLAPVFMLDRLASNSSSIKVLQLIEQIESKSSITRKYQCHDSVSSLVV